jgi:hypothetical protein
MFRHIRRWFEMYKRSWIDRPEPRPTVYKLGTKKFIKVKRLHTKHKSGR